MVKAPKGRSAFKRGKRRFQPVKILLILFYLTIFTCNKIFLYRSPNIVRVNKCRSLRWAGHVIRMEKGRSAFKILTGKPSGKRPIGRPRRRWEDNIRMDLKGRSLFAPNICLVILFFNTFSLWYSPNIRDHVSQLYRTTDNITV